MQTEEEYTEAELAEMIADAKPTMMVKLEPTDDWIVTCWCEGCEEHHHYLVTKSPSKRKKPWDGFQIMMPTSKTGKRLATGDGGLVRLKEKFETPDDAHDVIEENYSGEDDDEEDYDD